MVVVGPAVLAGLFLLGVAVVVYSVEVFIEAVSRTAVSLGVSGFFLAVVLAGVDVENGVLGVTAAFVDMPQLALGTVFGEALFVLAIAVGVAGIAVPFRVDVPAVYLVLLVAAPLPAFALSLRGAIGQTGGAALATLFVPLLAYIYWQERRTEATFVIAREVEEAVGPAAPAGSTAEGTTEDAARAEGVDAGTEPSDGRWVPDLDLDDLVPDLGHRSGLFTLGVSGIAILGLTLGSLLTVLSAEGILVAFGISELAFGATVLSFVASIEELALTVEPVRRGYPNIAVGNVVGSTVFYVTANAGVVAFVSPVDTAGAVMTVHWPIFAATLLVVTAMLARGRVTRPGGLVLVGLYAAYWIVNYA